jgi:hypothetical protein
MVNMCSHVIKPESQIEKPKQDSIFPERERERKRKKRKEEILCYREGDLHRKLTTKWLFMLMKKRYGNV